MYLLRTNCKKGPFSLRINQMGSINTNSSNNECTPNAANTSNNVCTLKGSEYW